MWDILVLSQLRIMFADRAVGCPLFRRLSGRFGRHSRLRHAYRLPPRTLGEEGVLPAICPVSTAPFLTLSKIAYTKFSGLPRRGGGRISIEKIRSVTSSYFECILIRSDASTNAKANCLNADAVHPVANRAVLLFQV